MGDRVGGIRCGEPTAINASITVDRRRIDRVERETNGRVGGSWGKQIVETVERSSESGSLSTPRLDLSQTKHGLRGGEGRGWGGRQTGKRVRVNVYRMGSRKEGRVRVEYETKGFKTGRLPLSVRTDYPLCGTVSGVVLEFRRVRLVRLFRREAPLSHSEIRPTAVILHEMLSSASNCSPF